MFKYILTFFVLVISGCAQNGRHEVKKMGKETNQIEYSKDLLECKTNAVKLYPYAASIQGGGFTKKDSMDCYSGRCFETNDGNENNRNNHTNLCMTSKGYSKVWVPNNAPVENVNLNNKNTNTNPANRDSSLIDGDVGSKKSILKKKKP